jgi:hypothetical protein
MYKWYFQYLSVSHVMACGCMDIRFSEHTAIDRWVVCEEHSKRVMEIVAKRKPLPDTPLPIEE